MVYDVLGPSVKEDITRGLSNSQITKKYGLSELDGADTINWVIKNLAENEPAISGNMSNACDLVLHLDDETGLPIESPKEVYDAFMAGRTVKFIRTRNLFVSGAPGDNEINGRPRQNRFMIDRAMHQLYILNEINMSNYFNGVFKFVCSIDTEILQIELRGSHNLNIWISDGEDGR